MTSARIRRARALLEAGGSSVEWVASEVGFGSSAVLRAHFQSHVGTSPSAYRKAFGGARAGE